MNPVTLLVQEHNIIKEAVNIAKKLRIKLGDTEHYESIARQLIDFFRNYADTYHHQKEELILFPEMVKANEMLEQGIVFEMFENHSDFRDTIANIISLLDNKNYEKAQDKLEQYCEALLDHIAVEDDEVFEIANSLFDDNELEKIYFRFIDSDSDLGQQRKEELKNNLEALSKNLE
ncbi:MAG: hemerythrin domain-containing protein [Bacteroidetes bacterium]|nr:hemerythrin domain-containing protein [Bacteroidota bacterium]